MLKRINTLQFGLLILTFVLGITFRNHFVLTLLTLCAISLAIYKVRQDKKELKRAIYYCRTTTSLKKRILIIPIIVILLVAIYFLAPLLPKKNFDSEISLYIGTIIFSTIIADYYRHFNNSIRSFDEGIKIPGAGDRLFTWNEITAFKISGNLLEIETGNVEKNSFLIDTRDLEDLEFIQEEVREAKTEIGKTALQI